MLDEKTGIDFPMFQAQLNDIFGVPNYGEFAKTYIRTIDLSEYAPHFSHVVDFEGNPWSGKIYGNYVLTEPLKKAFGFIVERGLAGELRTYDGCFNIRPPKGGNMRYSVHAYGLALDFNAGENPYGGEPVMTPDLVRCFAACGFEWGGLWVPDSCRDGMHFQLPWVRLRTDGNPLNPVAWSA